MNDMVGVNNKNQPGFTVAELIIIVIVVALLSIISIITYNGLQYGAQNMKRIDDIKKVQMMVESYAAMHDGYYPATTNSPTANWKTIDVMTDDNCYNGSSQADWVPEIDNLPQSFPNIGTTVGVGGETGCYLYASNGSEYIISAWNMVPTPQVTQMYKRQGFRTFQTETSTQFYTCNDNVTGGISQGKYDITKDYYKHSYTVTNIDSCDETPPVTH